MSDRNKPGEAPYSDIINMPRWEPATRNGRQEHPRMPVSRRAAIFAPFAALSGYGESVAETERVTGDRIELDESDLAELDRRLSILMEMAGCNAENGGMRSNIAQPGDTSLRVSITYFVPDLAKEGGEYRTVKGIIKKIDTYTRTILFDGGDIINIDDISWIGGEMFDALE